MREVTSRDIGLAFLVVILSGLSTAIGAMVVFFPSFVKLATRRVLASSLAISAGVMIYVSFVEILFKSRTSFEDYLQKDYPDEEDEDKRVGLANLYATLSFFLGVVVNCTTDYLVRKLSNEHVHSYGGFDDDESDDLDAEPKRNTVCPEQDDEVVVPHCIGCSPDPVAELHEWHQRAREEERSNLRGTLAADEESDAISVLSSVENLDIPSIDNGHEELKDIQEVLEAVKEVQKDEHKSKEHQSREQRRLLKMGLQTALAIGLHNFPEGLATFIAFLDEPSIGIAFAIAIAIHNMPEGFCVSLPVYYASGNRCKAFLWGTFSGVTEPIGALIGWLFFRNGVDLVFYGVIFGAVGGMMVMISLRELLPTAFRYDPRDTIVSHSIIAGMVLMSTSLVLFQLF